ncbi:uncharacterized protein LOC119612168 [Lucilia sericata]|uniref:uncharacterized protein LOC119612168 n=1 Tax=Lucilia sericata TaxID=13632 RepID=UPI0018A84FC8|nr:uncharacterized protein LOC119612168 [Lucilia sericata]
MFFYILIFPLTAVITIAENPNWYPDNDEEIIKKCMEDSNYTPGYLLINSPELHAFYLCTAKGLNIYSDDLGLNIERFTYTFFPSTNNVDCKKTLVQNCADQYKELTSKGELIFEVAKCISNKKNEHDDNC